MAATAPAAMPRGELSWPAPSSGIVVVEGGASAVVVGSVNVLATGQGCERARGFLVPDSVVVVAAEVTLVTVVAEVSVEEASLVVDSTVVDLAVVLVGSSEVDSVVEVVGFAVVLVVVGSAEVEATPVPWTLKVLE